MFNKETKMHKIKVPYCELSDIKTARTEAGLKKIRKMPPRIVLTYNEKQKVREFIARCESLKGLR